MAIKLVTGVPGSGKSYYAVNHIVNKHFDWDDSLDEYKSRGNVIIITDIDGLRLDHWRLDDLLKKYSVTIEQFFTVDFQEKFSSENENCHIVYLLDEIQRRFPAGYRNTDVLFYFQWHRHLGHDLYLMAQTSESVCKHIVALIEFEIKAVRESVKVGKIFKYHFMAGDLKVDEKTLKHDNKIFGLYTSYKKEDKGDVPKPLRKIIIRTAIMFAVMLALCIVSWRGIRKNIGTTEAAETSGKQKPAKLQDKIATQQQGTLKVGAPEAGSGREADTGHERAERVTAHVPDDLHMIPCGGLWVDGALVAVELWGQMVRVAEMPYSYIEDVSRLRVNVMVPGDVLAHVRPVLPAGRDTLYRGSDGELRQIGGGSLGSGPGGSPDNQGDVEVVEAPKNGYYSTNK